MTVFHCRSVLRYWVWVYITAPYTKIENGFPVVIKNTGRPQSFHLLAVNAFHTGGAPIVSDKISILCVYVCVCVCVYVCMCKYVYIYITVRGRTPPRKIDTREGRYDNLYPLSAPRVYFSQSFGYAT